MSETHSLAKQNIAFLHQARELVATLPDTLYVNRLPAFSGSVGQHLRHALEHYECFLAGWRSGTVDYDGRARDARVENEKAYAAERIAGCVAQLESVPADADCRPLDVEMDCGPHDGRNATRSTLGRELQFLISHTIHHYALIASQLRAQGHEPGAGFGVAPSTLKYRQSQLRCAQ